ncbi:MAG: hypothetical protein JWQ23_3834 [Herminiimonas sp.]|nr:hypothetical protein [Herminiimonas sp.]
MYAVALYLPGSVNDTAASDLPPLFFHTTVGLFLIAALITPCGVIHS